VSSWEGRESVARRNDRTIGPWLGIRRVQILLVEVVSQPLRPSVNLVQAFKTHRKMSALKID
jgi:hypothetical protein